MKNQFSLSSMMMAEIRTQMKWALGNEYEVVFGLRTGPAAVSGLQEVASGWGVARSLGLPTPA